MLILFRCNEIVKRASRDIRRQPLAASRNPKFVPFTTHFEVPEIGLSRFPAGVGPQFDSRRIGEAMRK